jgi:hypothetical protein
MIAAKTMDANVMSPARRSVIAACGTLLALAIHAALTPAPAEQNDLKAIHKRAFQFHKVGNYAAALIEAQNYEAAVKARLGPNHLGYAGALHNLAIIHQPNASTGRPRDSISAPWPSLRRQMVRATRTRPGLFSAWQRLWIQAPVRGGGGIL